MSVTFATYYIIAFVNPCVKIKYNFHLFAILSEIASFAIFFKFNHFKFHAIVFELFTNLSFQMFGPLWIAPISKIHHTSFNLLVICL